MGREPKLVPGIQVLFLQPLEKNLCSLPVGSKSEDHVILRTSRISSQGIDFLNVILKYEKNWEMIMLSKRSQEEKENYSVVLCT